MSTLKLGPSDEEWLGNVVICTLVLAIACGVVMFYRGM